jgi:ATP phosphoribosyltransferase
MEQVRLALPSGRIQQKLFSLFSDAGISIQQSDRSYRPKISLDGFDAKIFRSQNALEMLAIGKRDLAAAGADWVQELNVDVVEVLDTGLDPVSIIVAASDEDLIKNKNKIVIASEYLNLSKYWAEKNNLQATIIRSFGTTESFPPEDSDCIVDNMATGATIAACNLCIIDTILKSTTRLYASKFALDNQSKRQRIEDLVLLLKSVLEARQRVVIEINVAASFLDSVSSLLPAMKYPTISELIGNSGFVVKAAVLKKDLVKLVPKIKQAGGTDIIVTSLTNVIP